MIREIVLSHTYQQGTRTSAISRNSKPLGLGARLVRLQRVEQILRQLCTLGLRKIG